MKKILSILFACAISAQVFAQSSENSVHIAWGEEIGDSKNGSLEKIIGGDETGFYLLKKSKGDYLLEFSDPGLNVKKTVEISLKKSGSKRKFEDIILFANQLCLLSSELQSSKMTKDYYMQTVDKSSLVPNDDAFLLASFRMKGHYLKTEELFNFIISDDNRRLLVYYDTPHDKLAKENFGIIVLDEFLMEKWSYFMEMTMKDDLFDMQRYAIDNEGNVYLLGKEYKDKNLDTRNGVPNFSYKLLVYSNRGDDLLEKELSLPGKYITDAQLALLSPESLAIAGFYSKAGTSGILGSFYFMLDLHSSEIMVSTTEQLGIDLMAENLSDREEEKLKKDDDNGKDVELLSYAMGDLLITDDGGLILMAEQFYVDDKSIGEGPGSDGPDSHIKFVYNYNDILVLKMNAAGKILWREKIGKRQKSINDNGYYSSYAYASVNGTLYYYFNDDPRNVKYNGSGKIYNFKGEPEALTMLVQVGPQGGQVRGPLFESSPEHIIISPASGKKLMDGEMIIFGKWKKNQQFGRLAFQSKRSI